MKVVLSDVISLFGYFSVILLYQEENLNLCSYDF